MNLILLMFSFLSSTMIIFGSIINLHEKQLPSLLVKSFRYGKFGYKGTVSGITKNFVFELPKSLFKHFYCLGALSYTFVLYQVTSVYLFKTRVPGWFDNFLKSVCGPDRVAYVSVTHVYIALLLMTLQVYRRFYDTHFVSIFSKKAFINIGGYFLGMVYYPGTALALICESPHFAINSKYANLQLNLFDLTYVDLFAIVLFLWAWWHQHTTTKILANLRKNQKGIVVTDEHKLPYGDWFDYLSCPHQTAEILMYLSITILLWYNITWFFVFIWVIANQVETILLSHWWYQETFEKFPKNRKALIPFVY